VAACSGPADIPSTPNLTSLDEEFDSPSATLDVTAAEEAIAQSPSLSQLSAAFSTTMVAADDAAHAGDEAAPQTASRIRIQGGVHVTVRCPGELGTPAYGPDANNGTVSLTIAVAESRIRRFVGGQAVGCKLRGNLLGTAIRVGLDGPINFDLGSDVGLGLGRSGDLTINIEGRLTINDSMYDGLSARFTKANVFQFLYRRASDKLTAVLEVSDSGIIVRDRTGSLLCADVQSCVRM